MSKDVFALMQKRRSVFPDAYNGKPLTQEELLPFFEVANYAPTHRLIQPYGFKVFTSEHIPALLEKLAHRWSDLPPIKQKKTRQKLEKASAIAFILQKIDNKVPDWENVASVAMAVQNIWLAMAAENIGCYWSSPQWALELNDILKLEENQKCLGLLYIGRTTEYPEGAHPMRTDLDIVFNPTI